MSDMLEGGPEEAGGDNPLRRRALIESYFKKCKDRGLPIAEKRRAIARVNESFYAGDQYVAMEVKNGKVGIDQAAWFDEEGVPRLAVNLYTGLLMTWSALLTASAPTVKAKAAGTGPEKAFRAAFGDKVIRFLQQELDTKGRFGEAMQVGANGGTAGIKAVYNPTEDRIECCTLSVHDFILDPNQSDTRESRWVIFNDHCDVEEARDLYDDIKLQGHDPQEDKYKNAAGDELSGVVREEFWSKPTKDFPRGLYACFVASELVEEGDNPISYIDEGGIERFLLPGVFMHVRFNRGSAYGTTNFTDAVGLQRAYNEVVARAQLFIRKTSHPHMKVPAEIANFDPTKTTMIRFKQAHAAAAKEIGWTTPPTFPQHIFAQRDFFEQKMEKVVGLNAVTAGSKPAASMSGKLAEHLVELDQNRNADCTRSMHLMIVEFYRLCLTIMRRFYVKERQMSITDEDEEDVASFSKADLVGVDVALEIASETDEMSEPEETKALERQKMGLGGPTDVLKAQNSPTIGTSKRVVEEMLGQFLRGEELTAVPGDLNFDVVDEVIAKHRARAVAKRDMQRWMQLDAFEKAMDEFKDRADQLQPAQAPASADTPMPAQAPEQPSVL